MLRKLREPKIWAKQPGVVTIGCIREFMPSDSEASISVYFANEVEEILSIATALAVSREGDISRSAVVGVDLELMTDIGIKFDPSKGDTGVELIDVAHRNLKYSDYNDVGKVASAFLSGEFYSFEAVEIRAEFERMVGLGIYDFAELSKNRKRSPSKNVIESMVEMLSIKKMVVQLAQP